MVKCLNCNTNKNVCHIADGLYLCPKCEVEDKFHLVKGIETNNIYWKNVNWCICDEILI